MNEVIKVGISDELQSSNDYILSLTPEELRLYRAKQRYLLIEDAYGTDVAEANAERTAFRDKNKI